MSDGLDFVLEWIVLMIYEDMKAVHRWVDAILDRAVEYQGKITSPGFEAAARQYTIALPNMEAPVEGPIYDRWAAIIDFLSEPHVRRYVEHLATVMLTTRRIERTTTPEDTGTGPADRLPRGKNYKKNQRNRRKRKIRSALGKTRSEIKLTSQEGSVLESPLESPLVKKLLKVGVEASVLDYLLIELPNAVAIFCEKQYRTKCRSKVIIKDALKEGLPNKSIDTNTLTDMTLTKVVNILSPNKKMRGINTIALEKVLATKNVNTTSPKEAMQLEAVSPAVATLTTIQPDDAMAIKAEPSFEATSLGQEDANDLSSLADLTLDLQTNDNGIHQLPGDNAVACRLIIATSDHTQVEDHAAGSECGESEDSDTPVVLTSDGRNACEVEDLTVQDHPDANKFMEIKVNCEYCQTETSESYDFEKAVFCPGCGPCSNIRYCSKTCLLADCMIHQPKCGLQPGDYPVIWECTPSHMQLKYPYINSIGSNMTTHCFRQMVYAAVVDSDGIIPLPYVAYYKNKMPSHHRKEVKDRIEAEYKDKFISQGDYHIFVTACEPDYTGDTKLDLTIDMPAEMSHQFRRARNAAMLTHDMKLIRFIFHMIRLNVNNYNVDFKGQNFVDWNFVRGFSLEFPSFNRHQHKDIVFSNNLNMLEAFEKEWPQIEKLVKNLELEHPILRSWMTDPDPDALPVNPVVRYTGLQWLRQDPWEEKFIEGDPSRDWGVGWNGTMSDVWKFLLPVVKDEQAEKTAKDWNEILHGPKEDGHASWNSFRD